MAHFPSQAEVIVLDQRQMECLASPIRNEVFWAFAPEVSRSVADVAEEIGKSAQTVHYHLNALVSAGLLTVVGEQKKYARTEFLYAWAGADMIQQGPTAPREYRNQSIKSFAAVTRSMVREVEDLHDAVDLNPDVFQVAAFRHRTVDMTWEQAVRLKEHIQTFIDELPTHDADDQTIRLHVVAFASPTRGTSRALVQRQKKD